MSEKTERGPFKRVKGSIQVRKDEHKEQWRRGPSSVRRSQDMGTVPKQIRVDLVISVDAKRCNSIGRCNMHGPSYADHAVAICPA